MEIVKRPPAVKLPEQCFTGDAGADVVCRVEEPYRARANMVRFAPGARTAWHSHGMGQALYIVEGVALVQSRGGDLIEAAPGDVIWAPPGEEHWHGAAPDSFMIQLALWEADDATTWLDHVTDAEYTNPRVSARSFGR